MRKKLGAGSMGQGNFLTYTQIVLITAVLWCFASCDHQAQEETQPVENEVPQNIVGYKTVMPQVAGYDVFESHCITCHSLRYIQMQPDFPEKKWESIVDKMVKNFGAPIPDSTAKIIVGYLAEAKGEK